MQSAATFPRCCGRLVRRPLTLALVLTLGGMAFGTAQSAGSDELIRQGVERRRQGDDAGALELFQQAYRLQAAPRAAAQLGLAEQAVGRWVPAYEHLEEALAAKEDAWVAKNRPALSGAASRVAEHIGWIEILGGAVGSEVSLDSVRRGTLPLRRPLASTIGSVSIQLTVPGSASTQRTTTVRPGETTRESFDAASPWPKARVATSPLSNEKEPPQVDSIATPGGGPEPSKLGEVATDAGGSGSSARMPLVLTTAALSAGALVFALWEHQNWYGKIDAFDATAGCNPNLANRGGVACASLYESGTHAKSLAFVGYGAAAAMGVVSAVLFFALDPADPAAPDKRIACWIQPEAAHLACAVHF